MPEPTVPPTTDPSSADRPDVPVTADPSPVAEPVVVAAVDSHGTTAGPPDATVAAQLPAAAGRYSLGEEIARGGMGAVYRATDTVLDREVAVKVLQEKYAPNAGVARRFAAEARITAQLQHPNIPAVHDLGTLADGRPFLAMKLIKGQTLDHLLRQRADPAEDRGRFVGVFEQVCQAVAYAHARDVIHRDLKPANVMVGRFGDVQVMDWGLAKVLGARAEEQTDPEATTAETAMVNLRESDAALTRAGSVLGTPAYMPPEQAAGAVGMIDRRSDVFGLGAVLAVVLSGRPPFVGNTAESTRARAALGDVGECFARLDSCGADPDLVALCKRCLAPKPEDRPADAIEVAVVVAGLRAAADERARRAELERVRVEGEQATALARSAERRKRRRLVIGAAAVLALAVVGGLTAVLAVQRQANAVQLQANIDLEAKNAELAEQQKEVEARFEMAQKAIATLHTGVSEDLLLKSPEFKELRTKVLKEAASFYSNLEKRLAGKTDAKSRKLLADGYFQLSELTAKIGDQKEALAVQRKALALRRELAAAPGADVETRLDVARSLRAVALVLRTTGDTAGMLSAVEEQRDLAAALGAESPTEAVRTQLAHGHNGIGNALWETGKLAEALEEWQKALAIRQKLVDANSAVPELQRDLGLSHYNIGSGLRYMGKPAEAVKEYQKALAIQQKLADASPGDTTDQSFLAYSHGNLGNLLSEMGKPAEGLQELQKALTIQQKLADANPAVTELQSRLAEIHSLIGRLHAREKRFGEAFAALDRGLAIGQKLADAHPMIPQRYTRDFGYSHASRGWAHVRAGHPAEAAADLRRALELWDKAKVSDLETRFERSRSLALLAGLAADGKSGVTAAEAAALADQAVAALRDVLQAGWGQYAELKEPDFDALRDRPDFQKLVAEVEAKAAATDRPNEGP
jgi:tetratricopeptide (TPR) repeat protein/tRNA A-37 threonylcarbamoyl transferase component Bud32